MFKPGSKDIYIPQFFGPGTPVLVPGFQWSGWSKSGIYDQFRVFDDQIRARGGNHRLILNWQWYEI
jgi:hypothetical protein